MVIREFRSEGLGGAASSAPGPLGANGATVAAIAMSPRADLFAALALDGSFALWDLRSPQQIARGAAAGAAVLGRRASGQRAEWSEGCQLSLRVPSLAITS
jgi:lipid-binding SYLF domain-containing protein